MKLCLPLLVHNLDSVVVTAHIHEFLYYFNDAVTRISSSALVALPDFPKFQKLDDFGRRVFKFFVTALASN